MRYSQVLRYYSNREIREKMVELAKDREVVVKFDAKMGKRPNTIQYEGDILAYAKEGATSFHCSLERWKDPLKLDEVKRVSDLRIGWDLVIDVDTPDLIISKIAAFHIIEALRYHKIKHISLKFSGGTGFHIGVPYESFPELDLDVNAMYPELARAIGEYIYALVKDEVKEDLKKFRASEIARMCKKRQRDIIKDGDLDITQIFKIDAIAFSPRHLFRMPYSLNEKRWLVSLPIPLDELESFEEKMAKPDQITPELGFLDNYRKGEAKYLFLQALDYKKEEEERELREAGIKVMAKKVSPENFPPCIKQILNGLEDGRKRALFILMNFLRYAGYSYEEIEEIVFEWNKRNKEPLRESYVKTQLKWFRKKGRIYLTPSCDNDLYYKDIGVCKPDRLCKLIKNPLVYLKRKMSYVNAR